ncbi:MAG: PHP domain-containing protein, partial [Planctomycetes bacterium]|nr:PHP domain-containing protein [Planctomycetota bacterium]
MSDFVHLHVHSHFTLLESSNKVTAVIDHCKALGMPAIALTDRANLFGALEFFEKGKSEGVQAITGCQVNIAPLGMREKARDMNQLVLLAMSKKGYFNLCKLVSRGWLEGFYYEARVDLECIVEY